MTPVFTDRVHGRRSTLGVNTARVPCSRSTQASFDHPWTRAVPTPWTRVVCNAPCWRNSIARQCFLPTRPVNTARVYGCPKWHPCWLAVLTGHGPCRACVPSRKGDADEPEMATLWATTSSASGEWLSVRRSSVGSLSLFISRFIRVIGHQIRMSDKQCHHTLSVSHACLQLYDVSIILCRRATVPLGASWVDLLRRSTILSNTFDYKEDAPPPLEALARPETDYR